MLRGAVVTLSLTASGFTFDSVRDTRPAGVGFA